MTTQESREQEIKRLNAEKGKSRLLYVIFILIMSDIICQTCWRMLVRM